MSLLELLIWGPALAVGLATLQWPSALGVHILYILMLFVLARFEIFLPAPLVVCTALLLTGIVIANIFYPSMH